MRKTSRSARKAKPRVTKRSERNAPTLKPVEAPGPSEDEIRRRAYEIYIERGGRAGQDVGDWLQAERELREGPS